MPREATTVRQRDVWRFSCRVFVLCFFVKQHMCDSLIVNLFLCSCFAAGTRLEDHDGAD